MGVFGGSFDPIHHGHLILAGEVTERLSLDRTLLVPTGTPPHKRGGAAPVASAEWRLEQVRAAVAGDSRFEVVDLEARREGVSYTVDTLDLLAGLRPDATFFLLIGADQWRTFRSWRDPEGIIARARIVVFGRDGDDGADGDGDEVGEVLRVDVPRIDLSSTMIRERIRAGRSIRYLVPEAVRERIERDRPYPRSSDDLLSEQEGMEC